MSQVMSMKFNTFQLTVCNMIIYSLYGTFIITIDDSRGINWKSKLIQKLPNPICLCPCINNSTILSLCSWKRDYLLLLARPNHRSITQTKHIIGSGFFVITITSPMRINEVNKRIGIVTILDTKLIGTLDVTNNSLCNFPLCWWGFYVPRTTRGECPVACPS